MQPSNTVIYADAHGGTVFLTKSGAIGMECDGRLAVHTVEHWIALSWRDFPTAPTPLTLGPGDQSISLRGHPYER